MTQFAPIENENSASSVSHDSPTTTAIEQHWRLRFVEGMHTGVETDIPRAGATLGGGKKDDISILDAETSLLRFRPQGAHLEIKVLGLLATVGEIQYSRGRKVVITEPTRIRIHGVGIEIMCRGEADAGIGGTFASARGADDYQTAADATKRKASKRLFVAGGGFATLAVAAFATYVFTTTDGGVRCVGRDCAQSTLQKSGRDLLAANKSSVQKPADILRDLLAGYRVPARIEAMPFKLKVHHAMEDASRFAQVRGEIEGAMPGHTIEWVLANEDTIESRVPSGSRSLARLAVSRLEDSGLEATAKRFFSGGGRIVQVTVGDSPSVANSRGARFFAGADLGNGLTLVEITEKHLIIEGAQQRRVVLNHDGQRTRLNPLDVTPTTSIPTSNEAINPGVVPAETVQKNKTGTSAESPSVKIAADVR
jgi:hypothetical protein